MSGAQDLEEVCFGCVAGASDKLLLDIRNLIKKTHILYFQGGRRLN